MKDESGGHSKRDSNNSSNNDNSGDNNDNNNTNKSSSTNTTSNNINNAPVIFKSTNNPHSHRNVQNTPPPNLRALIRTCDGNTELTQTLLSELITKQVVTIQLLSRPSFRFIFNIVMEVITHSGFAHGM